MVLKIYRISKKNLLPCYMTEHASGIDLMASLESPVEVKPGEFTRISTGIIVSIPRGYA